MTTLKNLRNILVTLLVFIIPINASSLLQKRASRTSPPAGCLIVRGFDTLSGEYSTIKAALTALGSGTATACIFIYSGIYNEQISINYAGNLTVYGYTTKLISLPKTKTLTADSNQYRSIKKQHSNYFIWQEFY